MRKLAVYGIFLLILLYSVHAFTLTADPSELTVDDLGDSLIIRFDTANGEPDVTEHVILKRNFLLGNPFDLSMENLGGFWTGYTYVVALDISAVEQSDLEDYIGKTLEFEAVDINGNKATATIVFKEKEQSTAPPPITTSDDDDNNDDGDRRTTAQRTADDVFYDVQQQNNDQIQLPKSANVDEGSKIEQNQEEQQNNRPEQEVINGQISDAEQSIDNNKKALIIIAISMIIVIVLIIILYFAIFATPKTSLSKTELNRRKLKGYIDTQSEKGKSLKEIESKLLKIGYSQEDIDAAKK